MSELDDTCRALGCSEPRQNMSAEFCQTHQLQIYEFQRWLDGADEGYWPTRRSFDFERGIWSARRKPA